MNAITFDTLAISKRLRVSGFNEAQAERLAEELRAAAQSDISHVATNKEEMSAFKSELKADLREFEVRLRAEMRELELRMTIKTGAMLVAAVGLIVTLIKVL